MLDVISCYELISLKLNYLPSSLCKTQFSILIKHMDGIHHRVGRVLSLFSSRRNWDNPNP
jgi:hypothetical protein